MSHLTIWLRRASVHPWHSPGSVVAPGRPSSPRWWPEGLFSKPMPAAGKTAHVRRLLVDRSRCGLEVSPASPGRHKEFPDNERRAVVAMEGREPLSRRMWGRRPGWPGECPSSPSVLTEWEVSDLPCTDRTQGFSQVTYAEGGSRWKSPSKAGTPAFRSVSAGMRAPSWPSSRSSITTQSGSTSRCRRSATPGRRTEANESSSRSGPGGPPSGRRRPRTTATRPSTWRSPSSRASCARQRNGARSAAAA